MTCAISVIIPVYENVRSLQLCLWGLSLQTFRDFEVRIVNDGGDQDLITEALQSPGLRLPSVTAFYLNPPSTTFRAAAARNMGTRGITAKRVLYLDSDMVLAPDALSRHIDIEEEKTLLCGQARRVGYGWDRWLGNPNPHQPGDWYAHLAAKSRPDRREEMTSGPYKTLQPLLHAQTQRVQLSCSRDAKSPHGQVHIPDVHRLCWSNQLSAPTRWIKTIGGFWEKFVGHGGEDQELGKRLIDLGCLFYYDWQALAYHLDHLPRGDIQSNKHWALIDESDREPTLIRNGGPLP